MIKLQKKDSDGYVFLNNGDEYDIKLLNGQKNRDCDAEINVDGTMIGKFRVSKNSSVTIERSSKTNNRFKFVSEDSKIVDQVYGSSADKKRESPHNGLISIVFKPEYEKVKPMKIYSGKHGTTKYFDNSRNMFSNHECAEAEEDEEEIDMGGGMDMFNHDAERRANTKPKAGLTVMSDKMSSQTFRIVEPLNYDASLTTTINLRLVTSGDNKSKYLPLESLNSTPVPAKPQSDYEGDY